MLSFDQLEDWVVSSDDFGRILEMKLFLTGLKTFFGLVPVFLVYFLKLGNLTSTRGILREMEDHEYT